MSRSFNQAIVVGNLTRDPELRTTPSGKTVVGFGIATNRSWKTDAGEQRDEVEYHDIVVWGKLGEICNQYLGKGRKAMVIGRLQTRNWEDKEGNKRQKTEIIASDVTFMDGGGQSANPSVSSPSSQSSSVVQDIDEGSEVNLDDIPF